MGPPPADGGFHVLEQSRSALGIPAQPAQPQPGSAETGDEGSSWTAPGFERGSTGAEVYSAARHGKHKIIEEKLKEGFDPNTTDSYGNTIFIVACQNGQKKVAKLAVKYGGDINAQNGRGNTGLHFLIAYGFQEMAEYFISKGASLELRNHAGLTAHEGLK